LITEHSNILYTFVLRRNFNVMTSDAGRTRSALIDDYNGLYTHYYNMINGNILGYLYMQFKL